MGADILAFLAIAAVVIATPGPDTVLTIRNTLMGGQRAGVLTALGIVSGLAFWTAATAVGLAALLVASQPVFLAIRVVGGAYLVYLGLVALRSAVRPSTAATLALGTDGKASLAPTRAFRQGLLCNLGNPKIAIFFTSLLPQFVPAGGATLVSFLGLGALFATMGCAWLCGLALLVDRSGDIFPAPSRAPRDGCHHGHCPGRLRRAPRDRAALSASRPHRDRSLTERKSAAAVPVEPRPGSRSDPWGARCPGS